MSETKTSFDYTLQRSAARRRSMALTVDATGEVIVRAPRWVTQAAIEEFIRSKQAWIKKHQAQRAQTAALTHHYHAGETFYWHGEPRVLQLEAATRWEVTVTTTALWVRGPQPQRADLVKAQLVKFYQAEGLKTWAAQVPDLAAQAGETRPIQLHAAPATQRWGSCMAATRVIRLSARLLMAPPATQTYVLIHELCHLQHMHHGPKFWAKVGHLCPDYPAHNKALRQFDKHWAF